MAYYRRRTGRRCDRAGEDERLAAKIRQIYRDNYECYGSGGCAPDCCVRATRPGATRTRALAARGTRFLPGWSIQPCGRKTGRSAGAARVNSLLIIRLLTIGPAAVHVSVASRVVPIHRERSRR